MNALHECRTHAPHFLSKYPDVHVKALDFQVPELVYLNDNIYPPSIPANVESRVPIGYLSCYST